MSEKNQVYERLPLGQKSTYIQTYSPSLLCLVPRHYARDDIGIKEPLPFHGFDLWNGYELSWLNRKGKPVVAMGQFKFPCSSPNIVESKAFKLYLNSFNQSHFDSIEEVSSIIERDLNRVIGYHVSVQLYPLSIQKERFSCSFEGIHLDNIEIETDTYNRNPSFLNTESYEAEEKLYSHLLKSNCLITKQPDWGTVFISYKGKKINHAGLLQYIISYRNANDFAEHCAEQIYNDIMTRCQPEKLTVYCLNTRRGGLDINPFRSNFEHNPPMVFDVRQ